ncbi:MAG: hypothetical protein HY644_04100 [Acidobacteria bacterium]|nr:hypothetical protein [Acidobacteriota bacterium]
MGRKLLLINVVLLLLVILLGSQVRNQWRAYRREHDLTQMKLETSEKPSKGSPRDNQSEVGPGAPEPGNYTVIFEHNLFSANRIEFEPAEPVAETPSIPPLPGMPILNGVTVVGDKRGAFIQEPRAGAQPQNRTVQVGDVLMNFGKVKEIRTDALVFSWGDATHVVEMFNSDGQKTRGPVAARLQTTIITVGSKRGGPGPASGSGAASVPTAGPTIQIGTVGQAGGAAPVPQGNVGGAAARGGNLTNRATATSPGAAQRQIQPANQQPQNQNYIDTPFGRILRPARRTN